MARRRDVGTVLQPKWTEDADLRAWLRPCHLVLLACLCLVLAGARAAPAEAAGRFALVIGNSEYANAPRLPNAANDARDLAAALGKLGFEVDLGIDLKRSDFSNLVSDFRAKVKAAAAQDAVFFYAGHGFSLNGLNHLVPVDATLRRKENIPYETLQLDEVITSIQAAPNQQTIILLDACRNNPLPAKFQDENSGDGLAQFESTTDGIFVAFATTPGKVTRDGKGKNSPFTTALLKHIAEPNESLSRLMIKVRNDVKKATNGEQVPWTQESLSADFVFNPETSVASANPPAEPAAAAPQTPPAASSEESCDSPFGCDTPEAGMPAPKSSGAAVAELQPSDVTAAAEDTGQAVEGQVLGEPGAEQVPDPAAAGAAAPAVPATAGGEGNSDVLQETEIAALETTDPTRSAVPVTDALPAEVATAGAGGPVASAGDPGTLIEGTVVAVPDAANPGVTEPASPEPGPVEPQAVAGAATEATEAGNADIPPSGAGQVVEGAVLDEAEPAAPATAETSVSSGSLDVSSGTAVEGTVLNPPAAEPVVPAVTPATPPQSGNPEQQPYDVAALPPASPATTPDELPDPLALTKDVQGELKRIGCFAGKVDGEWGTSSRNALGDYLARRKRPADMLDPSDAILADLRAEPDEAVCVAQAKPKVEKPKVEKPKAAKPAKPKTEPVKTKPAKPRPQPPKPPRPPIFIGN